MTKCDQIKILNNKIKANNVQYDINRLNAEIPAFSEGDLDQHEFLTRKYLKYKPNALDKAKFEFSPLGKAFNQGSDKKLKNYKEEGVIKLLKDIRDKIARPIGGNNDDNDDNDDHDDNGNDNGNGDRDNKDSEYDGEYLLKLDKLLKDLKDDEKSLKTFTENIDDKSKEELGAEELERKCEKLKNKKILEAEKLEKDFENLKNRRLIKERIDALKKKLNDLNKKRCNKASSSETSSDSENN